MMVLFTKLDINSWTPPTLSLLFNNEDSVILLSVLQAMKRLATTWGRLTTWEGERLTTLGEGEGRLTILGGRLTTWEKGGD